MTWIDDTESINTMWLHYADTVPDWPAMSGHSRWAHFANEAPLELLERALRPDNSYVGVHPIIRPIYEARVREYRWWT